MAIENGGLQVRVVAILFLILAWISVGMRCYVKLFMTNFFRIDDWLAVASLVCWAYLLYGVSLIAR